jgi:hypothetical protein
MVISFWSIPAVHRAGPGAAMTHPEDPEQQKNAPEVGTVRRTQNVYGNRN